MTTFEKIVERLKEEPVFDGYKFRKSDSSFIQKFEDGTRRVALRAWCKFGYLCVRPAFSIRFDFVHKWFEKYSFRVISDQRTTYTVCAWPGKYGLEDHYYFPPEVDITKEYEKLVHTIKICYDIFFPMYKTPKDIYIHDILPTVEGKTDLPKNGAEWLFEYLTICKVVAPESYENVKAILLKHANWQVKSIKDSNMAFYYDHLDEILGFMESLSHEELTKISIKNKGCDSDAATKFRLWGHI